MKTMLTIITKKTLIKFVINFSVSALTLVRIDKGFATALVFKILVGQHHAVFQPIGKNCGPKFLYENIPKIILESLSNPAYHGSTYQKHQEEQQAVKITYAQRKIHVHFLEFCPEKYADDLQMNQVCGR